MTEPVTLDVRLADLRDHPKGRQFDAVAEASVGDTVVWSAASTFLRRGGGTSTGDGGDEAPELPAPSATWRVPADTGRRYAAVSGDRNPIHLDPVTARLFGFPRQIAHGMWSKARCLAALEGRLPAAFEVGVAFRKPVVLPATVGFGLRARSAGWSFALLDRRRGTPHLTGDLTPR